MSLFSCNENVQRADNAITVPINLDIDGTAPVENNLIDVNFANFQYLLESKQAFVMYRRADNCGACKEFKPYLQEYLLKYNVSIYSYTLNRFFVEDVRSIYNKYLGGFQSEDIVTPNVSFFANGQRLYQINDSYRYKSLDGFELGANQMLYEATGWRTSTFNGLETFLNKNLANTLIYTSGVDDNQNYEFTSTFRQFLLTNPSAALLDLELPFLSSSERIQIETKFGFPLLPNSLYLVNQNTYTPLAFTTIDEFLEIMNNYLTL
jgi:thiol-disulfide isomerase/thioredoxin